MSGVSYESGGEWLWREHVAAVGGKWRVSGGVGPYRVMVSGVGVGGGGAGNFEVSCAWEGVDLGDVDRDVSVVEAGPRAVDVSVVDSAGEVVSGSVVVEIIKHPSLRLDVLVGGGSYLLRRAMDGAVNVFADVPEGLTLQFDGVLLESSDLVGRNDFVFTVGDVASGVRVRFVVGENGWGGVVGPCVGGGFWADCDQSVPLEVVEVFDELVGSVRSTPFPVGLPWADRVLTLSGYGPWEMSRAVGSGRGAGDGVVFSGAVGGEEFWEGLGSELGRGGSGVFSDVSGAEMGVSVDWLEWAGIVDGCGEGRFCPDQLLTMGEMVGWLWKAAGSPVVEEEWDYHDAATKWFLLESTIENNDHGIPLRDLSRGLARGRLARWLYYLAGSPLAGAPRLGDVPLRWLWEHGLMEDCSTDLVLCSQRPLRRGEAAVLLFRVAATSSAWAPGVEQVWRGSRFWKAPTTMTVSRCGCR